jgi:hypothetical protein
LSRCESSLTTLRDSSPVTVLIVRLAPLDQDERAFPQFDLLALDDGQTFAAEYEEPLVHTAMPVVRTALGPPRRESHLGGL